MVDEVHLLNDDELRTKLRSFNLPDGPITQTTRKIFEKKLQKALRIEAGIIETNCIEKSVGNDTSNSIDNFTSNSTNLTKVPLEPSPITARESVQDVDQVKKKVSSTFYGVCLQSDEKVEANPQTPLVFTDKSEALLSAKKNSGARFKAFSNRGAAEAFAYGNQGTPSRQVSPVVTPVDPIGNFKAPKPAEIVCFRKLVEKGEVDRLSGLMYQNPKYLISSGDTPVILQEGFRYNAMHIAAKAGQKSVCKLVVNTLENDRFWNLIYPNSNRDVSRIRKRFVLDLYLNAPDKGLGETPLHFACKYGKIDVVEYFLSCPVVDPAPKNKNGETPQQIICSRVSDCQEKNSKIQKMFAKEETVFVPILRADDNCCFPKVGAPSPDIVKSGYVVRGSSPEEPQYKISAYAGPMSPQEAEKFCFTLKSPRATPEEKMKFRNIKRSDSEKGLERVARKVAKSSNISWCEYWKFLDVFTDLSSNHGLIMLEEYFRNKKTGCNSLKTNLYKQQTPILGNTSEHEAPNSGSDCVFVEKMGLPWPDEKIANEQRTPTGRNPNIKNFRNRLSWNENEERHEHGETNKTKHDKDLSMNDDLDFSKNGTVGSSITDLTDGQNDQTFYKNRVMSKSSENEWPLNGVQDTGDGVIILPYSRKLNFDEAEDILDVSNVSEDSLLGLTTKFERLRLSSEASCQNENIANTTTNSKISSKTACGGRSDDAADIPLFIEGSQPSKVDVDVLRAIKSVKIDPDVYPNIFQWQKLVRSFPKSTREVWPGPGSPRFLQTRKGIPKTWSC